MNQTRLLRLPAWAGRTAAPTTATRDGARRERRGSGRALPTAAAVLALVAAGRYYRDAIPITPETGVGYGLGIAGGSTMMLLTLYVARKKLRFMRNWGKLSQWFRIHMMLGVLAPLLILFHCNFRLGAPNSNVALGSMLLVATSGVIGRFLYTRINHGLYGARATLEEIHAELDLSAHTLGQRLAPTSAASVRLLAFATRTRESGLGLTARLLRFATLPFAARRVRRRVFADIRDELAREAERRQWSGETHAAHAETLRQLVSAYLAALVKEKQFRVYERLASLWHAVHIPLFIMLLLTGILHVVAVHMY